MRKWKKVTSILLTAAMTAVLAVGCGNNAEQSSNDNSSEKTDASASGKDVVLGVSSTWGTLMPWSSTTSYSTLAVNMLYEPLIDSVDKLEYRAASSIDISEDGTLWTVHLNEDCTWSDGEPCTADDWVWTYETVTNPDFGIYGAISNMAFVEGTSDTGVVEDGKLGIEKVDEYTFTIKWKAPHNLDSMVVTLRSLRAIPKHLLEDTPINEIGDSEFWSNPVGNGCCTLESQAVAGQEMTLKARKDFYLGELQFDTLTVRVVEEANAANTLASGDIDMYYPALDAEINSQLEGQNGLHLETDMTTRQVYSLAINNEKYNNNVRKAFDMLLDKDVLCKAAGEGVEPAGDMLLSYMDYFQEYKHERNVEEAVKILQQENFDFDNTVLTIGVGEARQNIATIVQQNLADGGVKSEIAVSEAATMFADQRDGKIDSMICGYSLNYNPTSLQQHFAPATQRYTHSDDPTIADLSQQYDWCEDEAEKVEIAHELQNAYREIMPWIFMYTTPQVFVEAENISNYAGYIEFPWKWTVK